MRIGDKHFTRAEIMPRVGNVNQVASTRHVVLADGRAKGMAAIDFDTGAGLRFTVLPDRGMDIAAASFKGCNLVYLTPNGEAHPAFYESQGAGWLRAWSAGLLTTCGLTTIGPPGRDGDEELPPHGRYGATPARLVCDRSGWVGDEYVLAASGAMEECLPFGDKLRLSRTISAQAGARSLVIHDIVENFGYRPSPFTILYHINFGFPLLSGGSRAIIRALESTTRDERSAQGLAEMLTFTDPQPGFCEQNVTHRMAVDAQGQATVALVNPDLLGGLAVYVTFDGRVLPYLNEWKMLGQGDYVVALEPCNAPCDNRPTLRRKGLLPMLAPGEVKEIRLEVGVLEGPAEIGALDGLVAAPARSPAD